MPEAKPVRLAQACVNVLTGIANHRQDIWLLDGDLADSYGACAFQTAHPERFVMGGIAEQNMVSLAAGLAAAKNRPWVFSFAAFLVYRAADQIRTSVSQTRLPVTLVGSHAGGCGGRNGKSHQTTADLAVIGSLPGFTIWSPCDQKDVTFAVQQILQAAQPAYLRAPRVPCGDLPGTPGAIRWLREGSDAIIVSSGLSSVWAVEAAEALALLGIHLGVLHVACIRPFPAELISYVARSSSWFVIEDHVRHGGLSDIIARHLGRQPDVWFGWPEDWSGGSGEAESLRCECLLDLDTITMRISDSIGRR